MSELPEIVKSWIGKRRHEEEGEFDVERGFVLTGCSSVENGNPLYWDEKVAESTTGGWIAPPTKGLQAPSASDLSRQHGHTLRNTRAGRL